MLALRPAVAFARIDHELDLTTSLDERVVELGRLWQRRTKIVGAGEDVLQIAAAHIAEIGARELLTTAHRAPRVRQQNCVALLREEQRVPDEMGGLPRPRSRRAAVNDHDERQLSVFPA